MITSDEFVLTGAWVGLSDTCNETIFRVNDEKDKGANVGQVKKEVCLLLQMNLLGQSRSHYSQWGRGCERPLFLILFQTLDQCSAKLVKN